MQGARRNGLLAASLLALVAYAREGGHEVLVAREEHRDVVRALGRGVVPGRR